MDGDVTEHAILDTMETNANTTDVHLIHARILASVLDSQVHLTILANVELDGVVITAQKFAKVAILLVSVRMEALVITMSNMDFSANVQLVFTVLDANLLLLELIAAVILIFITSGLLALLVAAKIAQIELHTL
jgi:hypothetical protein